MIQVTVAGMILDQQSRAPVLLLHIPPLDKYLPVWIGSSEAASISMALKQERFERPLTHDLMVTVIDGLDGKVTKVTITELRNNTFFAKIFIERGQQVLGIDARPSDSIAIAIRTDAPVFVSEEVIEQEKGHLLTLDEEATRHVFGRGEALFSVGDIPVVDQETSDKDAEPETDPAADQDDEPADDGDETR